MRRPAPQTIAAGAVLALLALIAVVTARRDAAPAQSFAGSDYGAQGYRAWIALLAREGIAATRFVLRPIELDAQIDTLISAQPPAVQTDPGSRTAADIGALAAWVRRGGRLVYLGRNPALKEAENRLLQLPLFLPDVGARGHFTGPFAAEVGMLRELGTNRMRLSKHPGRAELADGNGEIVVRYPLGRGEIVAVVDPLPFTNQNIAGAQNARLAYLVGVPRRAGGRVAFDDGLHGALIDRPWYRALPLPARVSLAITGFALLLGLIASTLRGSPPMPLQPAREPTSVEFLDALAALYERTAARDVARTILAADALATAARAGSRARGEDLRRLEAALGVPAASDRELVAGGKLAQIVRKDLSHGGNGNDGRAAFAGRARTRRRW